MTTPTAPLVAIRELDYPRYHTSPDGLPVPKSCPFCGGDAGVNTIQWSGDYLAEQGLPEGIRYGVNCMSCGVNNKGAHGQATPAEAIARWNKRAEPTFVAALAEEVERLGADARRIDRLAELMQEPNADGLLLHDGRNYRGGFGLGLLGRTLREAIDGTMAQSDALLAGGR